MSKEDAAKEIEQKLDRAGYTLADMISVFGQINSKMLMLSDDYHTIFKAEYDKINNGGLSNAKKGKCLEKITSLLFNDSATNFFDVFKNCRTSTNEIDLLIKWTENARMAKINNSFPFFGDSFLCECKNYGKRVGVTYVGKFFSLMDITDTNLGIMISWEGITGRGEWSDSKGLVKKIALRDKRYIIVIDKNDLKLIYDKKASIFSLINNKFLALKNDINFDIYIKNHEAEKELISE